MLNHLQQTATPSPMIVEDQFMSLFSSTTNNNNISPNFSNSDLLLMSNSNNSFTNFLSSAAPPHHYHQYYFSPPNNHQEQQSSTTTLKAPSLFSTLLQTAPSSALPDHGRRNSDEEDDELDEDDDEDDCDDENLHDYDNGLLQTLHGSSTNSNPRSISDSKGLPNPANSGTADHHLLGSTTAPPHLPFSLQRSYLWDWSTSTKSDLIKNNVNGRDETHDDHDKNIKKKKNEGLISNERVGTVAPPIQMKNYNNNCKVVMKAAAAAAVTTGGGGRKKVREPRFCFKTLSEEVDVLDDGYKWRKYGQKVVKNTQHPRSYYRCTQEKCRVKKRVERLAEDPRMVITTYEGRHIHSPSHDNEGGNSDLQDNSNAAASHFPFLNKFFW